MALPNVYSVTAQATSYSTAQNALQLACGAINPIQILRVSVGQQTSTASAMVGVTLARATGTFTVTGATTPALVTLNDRDAAAVTVARAYPTTAGASAGQVILVQEEFNVLNGWLYLPVPQEIITVQAAGFFLVGLIGTVPSATWNIEVLFQELG